MAWLNSQTVRLKILSSGRDTSANPVLPVVKGSDINIKTYILKVQEKFNTKEVSWNRAMDEVRTDRLLAKHDRDALLVIIRDWPNSEKYKGKPELVASLEYLVCVYCDNRCFFL